LDIGGALLPGVTGLGLVARTASKADDVVGTGKAVKAATEWSKTTFDAAKQQKFWLKGVENSKLRNIVSDLFRKSDDVIGGTTGAIHFTKQTGVLIGGSDHIQKGRIYLQGLKNVLKSADLSPKEINTTKNLIRRMNRSLRNVK